MTESTSVLKDKKKSKLPIQFTQDLPINDVLRSKDMNVKQKKKSDSPQYCKKMSVKQKIKQKIVKSQKHAKKLNVSNVVLKCNEDTNEYQNQQLNLMFQQSLRYPTLTQNELDILSMKYKVDGHYRANQNLPSFTSLLDSTRVTKNLKSHACEQTESIPNYNMQQIKSRNTGTVRQNEDIEDSKIYDKTLQSNFRHDCLTNTEIHKMNNLDNKLGDRYLYADQTSPVVSDYNCVCGNTNTQTHNNTNMLNDMHSLFQEKVNSNAKDISGLQEESFPRSLVNAQNITSEENQSYRNLFCNAAGPSIEHEISQQNATHNFFDHNDISSNSDYYNDLNFAKWNTTISTNTNSNCQSWKNVQSVCNPHIANMESCWNMKNHFATAHQLMLIKDHLGQQNDRDSSNPTNTYSLVNKKNLTRASNDNIPNVPQDFNTYTINASRVSDNFLSDTNVSHSSNLHD